MFYGIVYKPPFNYFFRLVLTELKLRPRTEIQTKNLEIKYIKDNKWGNFFGGISYKIFFQNDLW